MRENIGISETAIVVVDHGSRQEESNRTFLDLVRDFAQSTAYTIVEPAHMELAEPSLATAFQRCVQQGARLIVIHPYFLLPGRHWEADIPKLAAQAARQYPGVSYLVTAPIGRHPRMTDVISDRVQQCIQHATETGAACELCENTDRCSVRSETAS